MVDFGKLSIIIKREFLTRVRTKAFIITTILVPLGLAAILFVPILIQMMDSDTKHEIAIIDNTNTVYPKLAEIDSVRYRDYSDRDIKELRQLVMEGKIEGYVTIDDENIQKNKSLELIYSGGGGIRLISRVEDDFQSVFRDVRLRRAEASDEIMDILDTETEMNTTKLTEEGEEESANTLFLSGLGYVMAFIVYGAIFGYGGYVMRSVIEEKTSRIIEVVASSAKPFELLLGKVLGIGALGVTQCLIWVLAVAGLLGVSSPVIALFSNSNSTEAVATSGMPEIPEIDPSIGIYFVIFFVMGYLIYSAVLAAIGAAVDSESDTQQLMLPVMIPVIIAIIILPRVAIDPDSTFSVISSLIPFFSPVLMIARIPITDVPFWEIGLSIVLMIVTFIGLMWLSAKIYRVGILSYGKSANFKELMKWIRRG
jgi:ABC-2 type transport system permease protein